ncbi:MAG: ATP-binding protein [Alphaproteobacteria bacterium]|nr:ATP-binding protein [Alphaproteobacteria bacterium]
MHGGGRPLWRKPEVGVAIGGAAIIAVVGALQVANLADVWQKAVAGVHRYAANMALAVEHDTTRSFQGINLALGAVVDAFALAADRRADDPALRAILQQKIADLPYVRSIGIADENGMLVQGSSGFEPVPVGDRDYFQAHRDSPDPGLRVGAPMVSRTRQTTFVPVTRRLSRPDGSFAGVALAAVDPTTFERLYDKLEIGRDGIVALVLRNWVMLARTPAGEGVVGRSFADSPVFRDHVARNPSGSVRATGVIDGIERIYAYRTVEPFPLMVLIGLDLGRARESLWSAGAYGLLSVGMLSIMVVVATVLLVVAMRRQRLLLEQVRSSEQRFRDFAEVSTDWLYELDDQFRFSYISPRRQEVIGLPTRQRLGRTPFEAASAEELAGQRESFEQFRRHLESRHEFRGIEFWTRLPDGQQRWLSISGRPVLDAEGRLVAYRGAGTDLTQRKAAERAALAAHQRLMDAVDSLPDCFALFDADDRLVVWNTAFAQFYAGEAKVHIGLPFAEHAAFIAARAALPGELGDTADAWLAERLRRHREPGQPFDVHLSDGRWFRVIESRTCEGGIALLIADNSARRQAEDSLARAQKLEALGQLTGGIAHDFNNLLTVIMGQADVLDQDLPKGSPGRDMVATIMQAAERGSALTRQLLAFARRQPLRPARMDVNRLIRDLEPLLRRTLTSAIDVKIALGSGLGPCIADPAQLESAILNLAINARDAMSKGGVLTIETAHAHLDEDYVALNRDATAGDYVLISVTDNGEGMTPEVASRAFEPFFTTKPVGQGTGLGLSMVYGVIKQSGGHVKVYSEVGRGTTVKLYLPCGDAAGGSMLPGDGEGGGALPRGDETILLVEDDESVRKVVSDQLRRLGYRVLEAGDGAAAMSVAGGDQGFDLLLTDMVLSGGINGHELALAARRLRPALKVMFMSGYPTAVLASRDGLAPDVRLLGKPFTIQALARAVRDTLDRR